MFKDATYIPIVMSTLTFYLPDESPVVFVKPSDVVIFFFDFSSNTKLIDAV